MTISQIQLSPPLNIPAEDLQRCHALLGLGAWQLLAGQKIFITGGTGFVGKWLLATLLDADKKFDLGCHITVLSRDSGSFIRQWQNISKRVEWVNGDVRDFPIGNERYDVIIHAAADVIKQASPLDVFSTCLDGTRRVLELAKVSGARRFLLVSSGAVYGPLPAGMTHVPETYLGGPDPLLPGSAYGEGKRVSEWLVTQAATDVLSVSIARLFAVVGPHLPLDKQFAVGNFLRAAMNREELVVTGDGTPHRSYIYAADMSAWLWKILLRGRSGYAYNVGAESSVSVLELAHRVLDALNVNVNVHVTQTPSESNPATYYVPSTRRAQIDLDLGNPLRLDEALRRTARWYGHQEGARNTNL